MKPVVVAFDVIETLFSLDPLRAKFTEAGLREADLPVFFAQMLRDAFALEVSGVYRTFREVASANLAVLMATRGIRADCDVIESLVAGFGELPAHEDVRPALELLRSAGIRVITLSNGAAESVRKLLERSGLAELVELIVSIDEVRRWKPNREVYLHACRKSKALPENTVLVAAHAWDVHGAKQAGLGTAWVVRMDKTFHSGMSPPDFQADSLTRLVQSIMAAG